MNIAAVIVASGIGERFGSELPKQYIDLKGKPVITHTLQAFSQFVDNIVVVINKSHEELFKSKAGADYKYVFGGERRQDSVYEGLMALSSTSPDLVLIHDSVRPLVSSDIIRNVITTLKNYKAVDIALPMQDTIKEKGQGIRLLDRAGLYATQTPQGFCYKTIIDLHKKHNHTNYTDDISLAIDAGIEIGLVEGCKRNIKITTPEDLKYAEYLLS